MLFIRIFMILLLFVCTFCVYVMSASTYSFEERKQIIDNHVTEIAAADCTCKNGKCVKEGIKEVCKCPRGYGNYSRTFCKACDCGPNQSCMYINKGLFKINKICFCDPGYFKDNGECVDPCSPSPCEHGGICKLKGDKYSCDCSKDHVGDKCQFDCNCENGKCRVTSEGKVVCECLPEYGRNSDVCEACNCGTGANCTFESVFFGLSTTKYCLCPDGSRLKDQHCEDPCRSNPCLNKGKCRVEEKIFKCECTLPYTGPTCKDDLCTNNPCLNGGTCKINGESFQCKCKTPYSGKLCEKDPCTSNPCQNNGKCKVYKENFVCECKEPYKGILCQDGPCSPNPCQNDGDCEVYGQSFQCKCKQPFKGKNCEAGPCTPNPCLNHGTCKVVGMNYKCDCLPPYEGNQCEKDLCTPNPCQNNGKCQVDKENFKCECKEPYKGNLCQDGPCSPNPCHNNGDCEVYGQSFQCKCKQPFEGEKCETGACFSNPCLNHGTCKVVGKNYKCDCQPPYEGNQCEKDPCTSNPCLNKGYCTIEGNSFKCACKKLYFGVRCEKDINLCTSNPCQNEGICLQKGSSISCYCKPPYFGAVCEKDPCTENPCENGGTCVQVGYSFKCKCRHPFSGDTCQFDACSDNPCFNGGTCVKDGISFKCNCRYGYFGTICEKEGYESTLKETTEPTSELNTTSISTIEDDRNTTFYNYTDTPNESTNSNFTYYSTTTKSGICNRDFICLNGGICKNSNCECPPNFGGFWCEKSFLCEKLEPTCRAMGATCKIVGFNAICDCPPDKMYYPRSGMCEDICNPWKCNHGRCEIDGWTFKCICDTGYTGDQCSETVDKEAKVERSNIWFPVMISMMVFICLLLISQLCLFYQNRKFNTHTSDGILKEKTKRRV